MWLIYPNYSRFLHRQCSTSIQVILKNIAMPAMDYVHISTKYQNWLPKSLLPFSPSNHCQNTGNLSNITRPYLTCMTTHQMETFAAFLALCEGNSPVTGEFPAQRPVTQSFEVFFHLCLNKRLSEYLNKWWGRCFERPCHLLWRHTNGVATADLRWYQSKHDSDSKILAGIFS